MLACGAEIWLTLEPSSPLSRLVRSALWSADFMQWHTHTHAHTPTQTPYGIAKAWKFHTTFAELCDSNKMLNVIPTLLFLYLFFVFFFLSFSLRPKGSVAEFHVEVLKGFRVYTLVSCLHSCLLLNKGSFVQSPLECFLNMFQAVWAGN